MSNKSHDHHGDSEHDGGESKFRHDDHDDHHGHNEHEGKIMFSDNFNSYTLDELNWAAPISSGWTVTGGSVDIIGKGGQWDFFPDLLDSGNYVDLDGTSGQSGDLSHTVCLEAGHTYSLSFDLAGSHRGTSETVDVKFGTTTGAFTLASNDGFSHHTMNFTATSDGPYSFDFQNDQDGDNIGALLDNVTVMLVGDSSSSMETDCMFG